MKEENKSACHLEVYKDLCYALTIAMKYTSLSISTLNEAMFGEDMETEIITDIRDVLISIHAYIDDKILGDYVWKLQDLILLAENDENGWGLKVEAKAGTMPLRIYFNKQVGMARDRISTLRRRIREKAA